MGDTLNPALLRRIGTRSSPQTELVTRRDIRKYAIATRQRLPKFLAGDEAPPLFHLSLFWPVLALEELAPDGVAVDNMFPHIENRRPLAGGLKIDYYRPIRPGDVLTATRTLASILEKPGSTGTLVFIEVVTQVVNAAGEPVLVERNTRIMK
jgi:hydroxyacyl-ACP dehydratase HTD2-like protein with hotdog domain